MSPFAEALRQMLDGATDYTRMEWVEYLFTQVIGERGWKEKQLKKIESWLEDKELPRPHDLGMIWLLLLERYAEMSTAARAAFLAVAHRRATEVSPLGNRMLPTIWEYMNRLMFDPLNSRLAKLSPDEQGKLLEELYPETV